MPTSPPPGKDDIEASSHKSKNSTPPQSPDSNLKEETKQNNMGIAMMVRHDWCHGDSADDRRTLPNDRANSRGTRPVPAHVEILPRPGISHHVAAPCSEQSKNDMVPRFASLTATKPVDTSAQTTQLTSASESSGAALLSAQFVQESVEAAVTSTSQGSAKETNTNEKMSIDALIPNEEIKSPPTKKARRKRTPQKQAGQSAGRWTREEHQAFLEGLKECGREWKKVAMRIPTRTSAQIRSHAQKYFAKLQREQEAMALPDSASAAVPSESTTQSMTPSVQRQVQRILSDPEGAQREVENTMEALRERYRQLQLRLERRRQQRPQPTSGRVVENDVETRKRPFLEMDQGRPSAAAAVANDDLSSVSSHVSASVASLGNEELIALHVLGGSLPRGDSSTDGATNEDIPDAARSTDTSNSSDDDEQKEDKGKNIKKDE